MSRKRKVTLTHTHTAVELSFSFKIIWQDENESRIISNMSDIFIDDGEMIAQFDG